MKRSLWLRRMAAVTALALAAAACGNGDDETTETDTDPVEEPAPADEETDDDTADEPEDTSDEGTANAGEGDGTLQLGYVLPESGTLAYLGPPQIGAIDMAIAEINAAGGVLGNDVTISAGDEAGDATLAAEAAQRLIGEGVDAIIGAASSGMSLSFVDAVTSAGVLQCSPANTAPTFTANDYNGMYFRTAPTDALQGPVLAETIIGDGNTNPAILARADDYGQGLLDATTEAIEAAGGTVAASVIYDPEAANFDAEVNQVVGSGADSVAIVAFDEGAQILSALVEQGLGPANLPTYGTDGVRSDELASLVDPNDTSVLEGMKGTAPDPGASPDFLERFHEETGESDTTFAAQAYDCTMLIALAAIAADSDAGVDMAAEMINVSAGDTECASFEECKDLLEQGESIAYQAASGVTLTSTESGNGEPESASYEVWEIGNDGAVSTVDTVISSF